MTSESATSITLHLLIDTGMLWHAGSSFQKHPDFQKLLRYAKPRDREEGRLKIYVSHIGWEERRTQLVEDAKSKLRSVTTAFGGLIRELENNIVCNGLTTPALTTWKDGEIEAYSKEAMKAFAAENNIEVVALTLDQTERAWHRYFEVHPPFNPDQPREHRRKDIPDSWILEAAIDINARHPGLLALCGDGKLSDAMKSMDIRVFGKMQEVLDEIERLLNPAPPSASLVTEGAAPMVEVSATPRTPSTLEVALAQVEGQFKGLDTKILGFVTYLGRPSKEHLLALLSQSGVPVQLARNVCDRLVLGGLLDDTGNHYIAPRRNAQANELAAQSVEPEIIRLLGSALGS